MSLYASEVAYSVEHDPYAGVPAEVREASAYRWRVDSMVFVEHVDQYGYPTYLGYGRDMDHAAEVAAELAAEAGVHLDDITFSTAKGS